MTARLPTESNVVDRLFTLEGFNEAFAAEALPGVELTSLDIRVLLRYLQRDRQRLVRDGDVSCASPCEVLLAKH